jgi:glycosyltransferase involved in cell wall biosynthesis
VQPITPNFLIREEVTLNQSSHVSIVVPAFNEEETVASVVERASTTMLSLGCPFEIIVVDDGSTDATYKATSILRNTRVIRNPTNGGKGVALRRGFAEAKGDIVVAIDADGSHNPEELDLFIYPLMSENDGIEAVIGTRFAGPTRPEGVTFSHLLGNHVINALFFFLSGRYFSDTQCGYRAFKREVVEKLRPISKGFEIETEMLMLMRKNLGVVEVPIKCSKRLGGKSKLNLLCDGTRILLGLVRAFVAAP